LTFRGSVWPAFAAILCLATPCPAPTQTAAAPAVGLQKDVVFDQYSDLSRNDALIDRLLSPLAADSLRRKLSASGQRMAEQPIDLETERFALYVPSRRPPGGYGLLVFVPPWSEARVPPGWTSVLDRYGVIFVSAAQSGNDAKVISRRTPLALIAARNVMARYPVDPERVYIGGFSGGSRVAMRIAVSFPDLFAGALLDAGSDPLGEDGTPPPPRALLERFQAHSRVVIITGSKDDNVLSTDAQATQSMTRWCAFNVTSKVAPWVGHDLIGAEALSQGLAVLDTPAPANPARLAACRTVLENELEAGVDRVGRQISSGHRDVARGLIHALDKHFGGFAGDRLVRLAEACGCMGTDPAPN